jgi:succinate dehydrogenase / fumarate reductase cytochrome b subunit
MAARRPVYLNLARIHLPLAGWVSFLHRVSGALLFLMLPALLWLFERSLHAGAALSPGARLLLAAACFALAFHLLAGLRHLAMDAHLGTALPAARRSARAVLILAALLGLAASIGWLA